MSDRVLLNLINELRERVKMQGVLSILMLFRNYFIKFIKQEHKFYILFII